MPLYIYEHPETGDIKEIVQPMDTVHSYEENGVKWNRVFTVPQGNVADNVDPFNSNQFVERTGKKRGTLGNIFDHAAELSKQRAERCGGRDPVKDKWFDDYSKKRSGKVHPSDDRPTKSKPRLKIKTKK